MPQMNGLECLDRIMLERPCPVVMVSSLTAEGADATLEALRLGRRGLHRQARGRGFAAHGAICADPHGESAGGRLRQAAGEPAAAGKGCSIASVGAVPVAAPACCARSATGRVGTPRSGNGLVLVGTSTGGPPALEALLSPLPATFPWPIVIAQHMPASFTGPLARRLDGICAIQVMEVMRPTVLQAGCAYIGRGDADLIVSRRAGGLVAMPAPSQADYPWHPSTDRLVRSAMEHIPASQLVGVLMTGMGNDGAEAMALLHDKGGKTIAEAEETAVVWGMPGELVKAGRRRLGGAAAENCGPTAAADVRPMPLIRKIRNGPPPTSAFDSAPVLTRSCERHRR